MTNETFFDYDMVFTTAEERDDAFALYEMRRLPTGVANTYAGHRIDDNGNKVRLFAQQRLGNGLSYRFTEAWATVAA
jgi:hypothetical protein